MRRSFARIVLSCALLGSVVLAARALAADEDTQLWLYFDAVVPAGKHAAATFELSPRFRQSGDQWLTRATIDFKLAPNVSLGGGAAYVGYSGGHEFRTIQQLTAGLGALSSKTRIEERFFTGAPRMQLRLREKVQLSEPLTKTTRLIGAAELLYIARTETPADAPHVDSWRFTAAVQHRFSKRIDGTLGYLLIYTPRDGQPDKVSHVPQITLTARL